MGSAVKTARAVFETAISIEIDVPKGAGAGEIEEIAEEWLTQNYDYVCGAIINNFRDYHGIVLRDVRCSDDSE